MADKRPFAWALVGLCLAIVAFAAGKLALDRGAATEAFHVDAATMPNPIAATATALTWRGWLRGVDPSRVTAWVDGLAVPVQTDGEAISLDLQQVQPGHHLVELGVTHRGGRRQAVTDTVLVGPFAAASDEPRCSVAVHVSEAAIQQFVIPPVRERLLAAARANEWLGPDTIVEAAELHLWSGSARVKVTLAGIHRISVDAVIRIEAGGPRNLTLTLLWLTPVEFHGRVRNQVRAGGAALGAVAGALITGPLAPVGALGGFLLSDEFVQRQAQKAVWQQLQQALAKASSVALLPATTELVIGDPRSRVSLQFCGPLTVEPKLGLAARFSLQVHGDLPTTAPGPVVSGVEPKLGDPVPADQPQDISVSLALDVLNEVFYAWTHNGLLADRISHAGWVRKINAELTAWTTLRLRALTLTQAPVVMAADAGSLASEPMAWSLSLGGVQLDLEGWTTSQVVVAGRGFVRPLFFAEHGVLSLVAQVERLRLTCHTGTTLAPCFGSLLTLADVETRLNTTLATATGQLPAIDLRALLRSRTQPLHPDGLDVVKLGWSTPQDQPGVVRLHAALAKL